MKEVINYFEFFPVPGAVVGAPTSFTIGKIYEIQDVSNLNEYGNFIDDKGNLNGFAPYNHKYFKPSTEQAYCTQEGIPFIDKSDKKIGNYDYLIDLFKKLNIK